MTEQTKKSTFKKMPNKVRITMHILYVIGFGTSSFSRRYSRSISSLVLELRNILKIGATGGAAQQPHLGQH